MDQETMSDPADLTLDEVRVKLAPLLAQNAAFDGWTPEAVTMTAEVITAMMTSPVATTLP